jgi:peptidoglycan lytic transglycosylase D
MRALLPIAFVLILAAGSASATEDLFPRPPSIQPRVAFWTRVYTEVGTDGGLIHDSENLDVVYETFTLPEGLSGRAAEKEIDHRKKHYREILERLADGPRENLGDEEKRVLAQWPPNVSDATLAAAAERVRFQRGQADKFRDGLIRAAQWEPHIAAVFASRGLPTELGALPHVESSFNPRAASHAGAGGLWQFTRPTGRRFMRIDYVVDERFDPHRATEAAADLLRENYEKTGTWPLALTAYNHGAAGMERAVRTLGTRDIGVIVDQYQSRSFGFASRNFYAEFLAAHDVSTDAERYFGPLERPGDPEEEVIVTDHYYPASALAAALGVDVALLQELNPALRRPVWTGQKYVPRGYPLRVPRVADRPAVPVVLASIPDDQRHGGQKRDRYYKVQRGDALSSIARRYGVSQRSLMDLNGISNPHRIRAGQNLRIPDRGTAVATRRSAKSIPAEANWVGKSYRVQRGETLWSIAQRVGVPVAELASANQISRPDRLKVGQVLEVPPPRTAR